MKSRPSLFEAINKAPETEHRQRRGGLSFLRRKPKSESVGPIAAEAITEEEAAAELAARKAAAEAASKAKEARWQARQERREARKAAKEAARMAAMEAAAKLADSASALGTSPRLVRLSQGRLEFSLNTAACIVVAAGLCVLTIGSYSLGRRAAGETSNLATAAAVKNGGSHHGDVRSDLGGLIAVGQDVAKEASRRRAALPDPDLTELLRPPSDGEFAAKPNQPAAVPETTTTSTAISPDYNYLEVQYFEITRYKSSEDLKLELDDVRKFLATRGIETFARRHPKGFLLYANQGFPPSKEYRAAREAFARKIEAIGQDYRESGGLYEFKGCYFVSYGRATSGRPL